MSLAFLSYPHRTIADRRRAGRCVNSPGSGHNLCRGGDVPKGIRGSSAVCEVPTCGRKMLATGLCSMHWQRAKRHGSPGDAEPAKQIRYAIGAVCLVTDCGDRPRGRGLCMVHWTRWKKYGDPATIRQAPNGAGHITAQGYRMLRKRGHPLASINGFVFEHRAVLYGALGPDDRPCHWCHRWVSWWLTWPYDEAALVVDHLDWDKLNNAPANLVPSCNRCNDGRTRAA